MRGDRKRRTGVQFTFILVSGTKCKSYAYTLPWMENEQEKKQEIRNKIASLNEAYAPFVVTDVRQHTVWIKCYTGKDVTGEFITQ